MYNITDIAPRRSAYMMCSVDVALVQSEPVYVRITRYTAVLHTHTGELGTLGSTQYAHSTHTHT